MARNLISVDIPLTGGGEQSAASMGEFGPGEAWRLENGEILGRGIVAQVGDWRLAATLKNAVGTPPVDGTEANAVIGIFPFSQVGGLGGSSTSGGVAFSFNTTDNKIYLHHLSEDGVLLRTLDTSASMGTWTLATPPQVTGFEAKGRFYFVWDGREATSSRKGLGYYDPASTGTITKLSVDIEGAGAGPLLFKGISLHLGGTILGWGYDKVGDVDAPHQIRYNKYTDFDTWIAAIADGDVGAGKFPVGTIDIPIIGCAQSGQYTVIGKEREVFALDGNYSSQFNLRPIGSAHGPVSATGIVSIGDAAVWMSEDGPAISRNGGNVDQLGVDKILRRFLTYFDLTYAQAVHHSVRNRVGWLLKRQYDFDGLTLSNNWGDEILWWDYQRDLFYVERTPEVCFSIGTLKGTGQVLGPSAAPSNLTVDEITTNSAQITWESGDAATGVTTKIEYKPSDDVSWTVAHPSLGSGAETFLLTGLLGGTEYDIRLTHHRNGIASATYTESNLFFTAVNAPSNVKASSITSTTTTISWVNGETSPYTTTVEYRRHVDTDWIIATTANPEDDTNYELTGLVQGTIYDVRVRHVKNSFPSDYAEATPLFTTNGGGIAIPTLLAASDITGGLFRVNWTNGDPRLPTRIQYKKTSDSVWITHSTAPAETPVDDGDPGEGLV